MRVLIIDNYDSFTFNLYQYVGDILENDFCQSDGDFALDVVRNDDVSFEEVESRGYDRIVISPGPGTAEDPEYFGICKEVIQRLGIRVPVLGVCLGMQGIYHVFGGRIRRASVPMHGKVSRIRHDGKGVFANLPQNIEVMRYHSLVADPAAVPDDIVVSSTNVEDETEIMGIRHRKFPIEGIQFHPESFATEGGKLMLKNFLCLPEDRK